MKAKAHLGLKSPEFCIIIRVLRRCDGMVDVLDSKSSARDNAPYG